MNHGKGLSTDRTLERTLQLPVCCNPTSRFGSEPEQTGEEWFSTLSEAQQKEMMGAQTWDAWKGGAFDFKTYQDTGTMTFMAT